MKCFIVLSALVAVALARPGHLLGYSNHVSHVAPLTYAAPHAYIHSAPAAPIGHDGRVVDTPEVAHAKAEHAAAHALAAQESSSYYSNDYASLPVAISSYHGAHAYHTAAPIGHDGRVVDTPEVAHAKAVHAAAHAHEKASHSADHLTYAAAPAYAAYHAVEPVTYTKIVPAAPIGHDGRVIDTPEVAHLKAAHLAAHEQAKAAAYDSDSYEPHYVSAHQW